MEIIVIKDKSLKQAIAKKILSDLPKWFGIDSATREYVDNVAHYPFIAAKIKGQYVGFYALREENPEVLDMYVLGVLKAYHNQGIGQKLQAYADDYAKTHGYIFLMVLTLAKKANHAPYLKTRAFYLRMGFLDFYQNDKLYSKDNPCQIMIKPL